MDFKNELATARATIEKYDFWDRHVYPYGFKLTVRDLVKNWEDYDKCTEDSKAIIRDELSGFLPILKSWAEYEAEPRIKVRFTQGVNEGKIMDLKKSVVDAFLKLEYVEVI